MNNKFLHFALIALAFYMLGIFFPAPGQKVASTVTGLVG